MKQSLMSGRTCIKLKPVQSSSHLGNYLRFAKHRMTDDQLCGFMSGSTVYQSCHRDKST